MVDKKGFMRTLEAFIAILITIIFIIMIAPKKPTLFEEKQTIDLLDILSQNDEFRNCVVAENNSCVNSYLNDAINVGFFNYTFNISSSYYSKARINKDNVFLKTYFVSGNGTTYNPKIIKLYYWREE